MAACLAPGVGYDPTSTLVNSQPSLPFDYPGMNWWTDGVPPPASVACKASVQPSARPELVPRRGFDPRSPALQAGAFTRLAYEANLERPAGNDPASSRWQREALPLSYGRNWWEMG